MFGLLRWPVPLFFCKFNFAAVAADPSPRFLQPRPAVTGNSTNSSNTELGPQCSLWPGCQGLSGDCCPAWDGGYNLSCCSASGPPPSTSPAESAESTRSSRSTPQLVEPAETSSDGSAWASRTKSLPMEPFCDRANVGFPNCGAAARCETEYSVEGSTRILQATTEACAYVTFKTGLSLRNVAQLDADVFISSNTCHKYDNLAFWFFQTVEVGDAYVQPTQHWDAVSEVDLMETYIGPGNVNSINTNFAATGLHRQWPNVTIEGGVNQHVTMWQDVKGAGCPTKRESGYMGGLQTIEYGASLPVVSIYVAHCAPGAPCCKGTGCKRLQGHPNTAWGCITVKEAPILLALSNWGAGHHVTPGCQIGVSDVTVTAT